LLLGLALDGEIPPAVLDILRLALDPDSSLLLHDVKSVQRVKSGSVFDITSGDLEAGWKMSVMQLQNFVLAEHLTHLHAKDKSACHRQSRHP